MNGAEARLVRAMDTLHQQFTLAGQTDSCLWLESDALGWRECEATAILRRCAEAARAHPSGRVVILNGVSPDDERPSPELLMMVLVGGKDRSLSEFRALALSAGLEVVAAARQPSGRFVVECRPV